MYVLSISCLHKYQAGVLLLSSSATTKVDQLQFTTDDAASNRPKKYLLCSNTERQVTL